MLLTLGCPGAKCASDALWLKDKRAELFVVTRWNQVLTELVIFQWNGHQMGWAACFWLTGVLDVAGACWEKKTLPRSKYVLLILVGDAWQDPEARFLLPWRLMPQPWCRIPPPWLCVQVAAERNLFQWCEYFLCPLRSRETFWKEKRESFCLFIYLFNSNCEVFE